MTVSLWKSAALAATMALAAVTSGHAANVDATDPQVILNLAKGYGSGTLDKDSGGDPMIKGRIDGIGYAIFFFGCKENKDCKSVNFYASWDTSDVKAAQIADWNLNKRFAKAYLDKSGQPAITMDVNLFGGVTSENFEDDLDWWRTMMAGFKTEVIDKAAK